MLDLPLNLSTLLVGTLAAWQLRRRSIMIAGRSGC